MREFQERRLLRKIIFSRFTSVFMAGILVLLVYAGIKVYLRSQKAIGINEAADQERAALEIKKSEMEALIKRLGTGSGAEEEIRNKFMLKKPGENMVVIVDDGSGTGDRPEDGSSSGLFSKIWQFVKEIF